MTLPPLEICESPDRKKVLPVSSAAKHLLTAWLVFKTLVSKYQNFQSIFFKYLPPSCHVMRPIDFLSTVLI